MFRLIIFLIVSSITAYSAAQLAEGGSLTFSWGEVTGTLPIGLVAGGLAILAFSSILLWELWRWLTSLPAKLRKEKERRDEIEGYQALSHGMIAAAAGDTLGARANAKQAERLLGDRSGLLLLTAQTAQLEGQEDVAQLKFKEMLGRPETEFLGLRGLLAEAVRQGDYEDALDLARKAFKRSPSTSWVLTTLFDLLTRFEQWGEAIGVINELARQRLLSEAEATHRRGLMHFLLAEEAMEEDRIADAYNLAKSSIKFAPDFTPAVASAAHISLAADKPGQAARFIERAWRTNPHPELATIYAQIQQDETPADRLSRFERLLSCNPKHSLSHAIMAELALSAGELDKARTHLEQAITLDARAGHFRLLADLERSTGASDKMIDNLQNQAIAARPDPQWICLESGEILPQWRLFGLTGRFDGVRWEEPPRVAELIRHQPKDYRLDQPKAGAK